MKLLILFVLFLVSCRGGGVYDLVLKDMEGRDFRLSRYEGKKFVVYVWSGTCIGHVEDLKRLSELAPKMDVPLVSVAVMMDVEDVKEVLRENNIKPSYPVLADPKGRFADEVTLIFLPSTIIFDEEGRVVENYPKLPPNLISLVSSHE